MKDEKNLHPIIFIALLDLKGMSAPPPNLPPRGRNLVSLPLGGIKGGFPRIPKDRFSFVSFNCYSDSAAALSKNSGGFDPMNLRTFSML